MATPGKPDAIQVRWPGGEKTIGKIPENAAEIIIQQSGAVTVVRSR